MYLVTSCAVRLSSTPRILACTSISLSANAGRGRLVEPLSGVTIMLVQESSKQLCRWMTSSSELYLGARLAPALQ
eukprot:3268824-Prymnesium_polylepis.1